MSKQVIQTKDHTHMRQVIATVVTTTTLTRRTQQSTLSAIQMLHASLLTKLVHLILEKIVAKCIVLILLPLTTVMDTGATISGMKVVSVSQLVIDTDFVPTNF